MNSPQYHIPILEKVIHLLEFMSVNSNGVTLQQMVDELAFSKSTLFRITQTLEHQNIIAKNPTTGAFFLTTKLLNIGLSTLSEQNIIEKALAPMKQLRDDVKETVLLGTLDGNEGVMLEQVQGLHNFIFTLSPGKRFNLHASAPGKAMLAFLSPQEQKQLAARLNYTKYNERTIITAETYLEHLKHVRECGYAVDFAEEIEGVHCIGAPIFDKSGRPIAAIWTTGPSVRLTESHFEEIGQKMCTSAMDISNALGYFQTQKVQPQGERK